MKNIASILTVATLAVAALGSCKPKPVVQTAFDKIEKTENLKTTTGAFEVMYGFEYLSALADPAVLQKVQKAMASDFFGPDFARTDAATSAAAFDASLGNAYGVRADSSSFSWDGYLHIQSAATRVGEHLVHYTVNRDEYTGGAHGMATTTLANYDLRTGARLTLDDLFTPEGKAGLAGEIRGAIIRQKNVAAWDELVTNECFNPVDRIFPTENFTLTEGEIIFFYNPYDIACYAAGSTEVSLPLANLAGFRNEIFTRKP
jgi:hypothetical protein